MYSAIILFLTMTYGNLSWDNLNQSNDWDCYSVDGDKVCQVDIQPCHYVESPEECRVVISFRAGKNFHSLHACQSKIPGCVVETWTSPIQYVEEPLIRPVFKDRW